MNPNQGRESAHIRSRVKDLSLITNTPDYVALFACITPHSSNTLEEEKIEVDGVSVYLPQLVRDVDTLTTLFGDPRVDPNTYKDLYLIRSIIQSGFACYVAKVNSGKPYLSSVTASSLLEFKDSGGQFAYNPQLEESAYSPIKDLVENTNLFTVKSSVVGVNKLSLRLIPMKPFSINQVALEVVFSTKATQSSEESILASARVLLSPDTRNIELVRTLNAYLGGNVVLQLPDSMNDEEYSTVDQAVEFLEGYCCITNLLLYTCGVYSIASGKPAVLIQDNLELRKVEDGGKTGLQICTVWTKEYLDNGNTFSLKNEENQSANLEVSQSDYIRSISLYKDPKYAGCFISDLSSDIVISFDRDRDTYYQSYEVVSNPSLYFKKKFVKIVEDQDPVKANMEPLTSENAEGDRKIYTVENIEGEYKYTLSVSQDDPDETYYVRKDESNPNLTESVAPGSEGSNFETLQDDNRKYTKVVYKLVYKKGSSPEPLYVLIDGEYKELTDSNSKETISELVEMPSDSRRGYHCIIKDIASSRKDLTCIFTTPYEPCDEESTLTSKEVKKEDLYDLDRACNWVAARGEFNDLIEYGNPQAIEYTEQSFYCEMYWSWLKWRVPKLVNGLATGNSTVIVPPTAFVIRNALTSYRNRGTWYPVAGDQGGVLPASCVILQNPTTKSGRDKLISYRINPIYDTGLRGIQIYGNESLNPQYTDLSSAHIARTLVNIRSRVDAYSETIKFSLNDIHTWGAWVTYVSTRILDPIKDLGGLQWYQVDMGYGTTTREEIAQRKIRGMVSLQFTQSLEIIDLEFVTYSSALDMESEE